MSKAFMVVVTLPLIFVVLSSVVFASQTHLSLSDKEIIEKLSRLEEGQKS